MYISEYRIKVLRPAPSMNHDEHMITGTYQQAVDECHRLFQETGRSASVYSGQHGMYCWHHINGYTKQAIDKNTNSGVVFTAQY